MKYSIIVMVFGYWARGETIGEAAKNVRKEGAFPKDKAIVILVMGDDKPFVNESGSVCYKGKKSFTKNILKTKLGRLMEMK